MTDDLGVDYFSYNYDHCSFDSLKLYSLYFIQNLTISPSRPAAADDDDDDVVCL